MEIIKSTTITATYEKDNQVAAVYDVEIQKRKDTYLVVGYYPTTVMGKSYPSLEIAQSMFEQEIKGIVKFTNQKYYSVLITPNK